MTPLNESETKELRRTATIIESNGRSFSNKMKDASQSVIVKALAGSTALFAVLSVILFAQNHTLAGKMKRLESSLTAAKSETASLDDKLKKTQALLDGLKRENESLGFEMKKTQSKVDSIAEEKSYLEDILVDKTKELERLKSQAPAAEASAAASTIPVDGQADEVTRLREENKILSAKLERIYQAAQDKITAIREAKAALEASIDDAKKKMDDEWSAVNLGAIKVDASAPSHDGAHSAPSAVETTSAKSAPEAAVPSHDGAPKGPRQEGHVRVINDEHGFVIVDLGKVDNVKNNSLFDVYHEGEKIATLSVLEIRDVMSACNIQEVAEGRTIAVSDSVTIRR